MNDSIFTNLLDGEQKRLLATAIVGWAIGDVELLQNAIKADENVEKTYDVFANFFGLPLMEHKPHLHTQYTIDAEATPKPYERLSFPKKCEAVKQKLLHEQLWCENMHRKFHIQVMPEAIDEFFDYIDNDMKRKTFMRSTLSEIKYWFGKSGREFLRGSLVWADRNRTKLGNDYYMHTRDEC